MWHEGYGAAPWTRIVIGGVWLAFVLAAVGVAVWFLSQRGHGTAPRVDGTAPPPYSSSSTAASSGPLTILEERLARGEVDVATYRMLRAELAPPAPRAPAAPPPQPVQAAG
jgi:uncharacterized membrane protein